MKGDLKWKVPLIVVCVLFSVWYLFPLDDAINLGLDLQGGLHLVLEVQAESVVENELVRAKETLNRELKRERIKVSSITVDDSNALKITASSNEDLEKLNEYLDEEFSSFERKKAMLANPLTTTIGLPSDVVEAWKENAIKQALMTIRNRVDEFGLTEPVIQRQGKKRIIVELAGEKDPQRAIDLIGKTAELRFQLVRDLAESKETLLERYDSKLPEGTEILTSAPETKNSGNFGAYLVEREAEVTGADLKDARVSKDELGMPAVSFEFDRDGARRFGALTEENIGNALAIVLDETVQSAPVIRSRITDRGQITGNFTSEEANDLAIVLRAGALPAPVKILENISVGPSLGEDSIQAGKQAIMIGGIVVILFMLVYYKVSGLIANVALLFNLLFIMGILAYFQATLTLPGLAGIALTVGMAVDANVLIFERIKEERRRGKTLRSAVENGFTRAHLTILDANLTTLIAAVVLFQFGTGPVKGFAVTLSIGILSTLFTALILSKVIFDVLLQTAHLKRISM
ncbi:protein translocase subunit SecD [candidate division KSB3 bacterium]|uniref:Protein translocase subunit SecD n=1 Tax=candidate division KSB3 bacterium TaxID=2044937 RepID=A0A9D5K152_9BACT|nr:protein translocase subunit SecD [candidate division KSB3 bacterium]MBD3327427.1 protein translocase subunit SecD [candidate division KSB3 bacterium]